MKAPSTALMWLWFLQQCNALPQSFRVCQGEKEGRVQSRGGKMDCLWFDPSFVHLRGTAAFAIQVIKFATSSYFDSDITKLRGNEETHPEVSKQHSTLCSYQHDNMVVYQQLYHCFNKSKMDGVFFFFHRIRFIVLMHSMLTNLEKQSLLLS